MQVHAAQCSRALLLAVGLTVLVCRALAQAPVTFRDGEFLESDWETIRLSQNADARATTSQGARRTSGGNPGAFLEVSISVTQSGDDDARHAIVFIRRSGASYDPATQGPIGSIGYSEDARNIDPSTTSAEGQKTGLAVRQNGRIYVLTDLVTGRPATWQNLSRSGLNAGNFAELNLSTGFFNSAARPDFSRTGGRIEFGFWRGGQVIDIGSGGYTPPYDFSRNSPRVAEPGRRNHDTIATSVGIDNWTVTLSALVQPGISCRFTPRNAFMAFHRQELHLVNPTRYPIHGLSVDVTLDGAPARGVDVTLMASQPVFSSSPTQLPSGTQATLRTDNNGRVTFSINPASRGAFDRTDFVAEGTTGGRRFTCRNTIVAGYGTLSAPLQGFMDVEVTRAFVRDLRERLLALGRRIMHRPELLARVQRIRRYRELASKLLFERSAVLTAADLQTLDSLMRRLERGGDRDVVELVAALKGDIETARSVLTMATAAPVGPRQRLDTGGERAPHAAMDDSAALRARIEAAYGRVPLSFEPNQGQSSRAVRYLARSLDATLFLTAREAIFSAKPQTRLPTGKAPMVKMQFARGNPAPRITAAEPLAGVSHYLAGTGRSRLNVPQYAKVIYEKVYPGVDVVFYGRQREFQFDFVVAPGARPENISLVFTGVDGLEADGSGGLLLHAAGTKLRVQKPFAYQEDSRGRRDAGGRFVLLAGNRAGFALDHYDRTRTLIIDPIISYGTYLGGTGDDTPMALAVDREGNAYITGATSSSDLPVTSPLQAALAGTGAARADVFVTKLNAAGTAVLYSTYIGGSGGDIGMDIAVDSQGNAYVAGATTSTDFPLMQPIQNSFSGGITTIPTDAFVLKLNTAGSALTYSTYIGGTGGDAVKSIAVDAAGSAFIAGFTSSTGLPVRNAFQPTNRGGAPFSLDGFAGKLSPSGAQLEWLTYLGGSRDDVATAIAVDPAGNSYVTGKTYSADFPMQAALQRDRRGTVDAFVSKFDSSGSRLIYSTYHGGESYDVGMAIAADAAGNAYVAGVTGSAEFPVVNPAQRRTGAEDSLGADAFVSKLSPNGSALVYSTYLGGRGTDVGHGIAVTADGSAWIAGETDSPDFPSVTPVQTGGNGLNEAFIVRLSPAGSTLQLSTLLGGSSHDTATSIALDSSGNPYVAGASASDDVAVTYGAAQGGPGGRAEALVVKLAEGTALPRAATVSAASYRAAVSPDSIASLFGASLAPRTEAAVTTPLPVSLAGVSVQVKDREGSEQSAPLFVVSPAQINFLVPERIAAGLAEVRVLRDGAVAAAGIVRIDPVAPALFTASSEARGVASGSALRVSEDGTQTASLLYQCAASCRTLPVGLGRETDRVFLLLFGTGIRHRAALSGVTATIGGIEVPVAFAGPQGDAGLDQVNVGPLPRSLAGRGDLPLVLTVDGKTANTVMLAIQ